MKQPITILTGLILILGISTVNAQEYRYDFGNSPELAVEFTIDEGEVFIEGHDSEELVIRNLDYEAPPERADGLRALYNSTGDNTGIGLSVVEEDGTLKIVPTSRGDGEYSILLPNRVRLKIEEIYWGGSDDIEIHNHMGEIEVLTRSGDILMDNVTGPVIASTTDGDVEIYFSGLSQTNPTSISVLSGFIDITLPADTRASFQLNSFTGEIYTDLDIAISPSNNQNPNPGALPGFLPNFTFPSPGRQIEGTLNGGGVEMSLKTVDGEIYLRRE